MFGERVVRRAFTAIDASGDQVFIPYSARLSNCELMAMANAASVAGASVATGLVRFEHQYRSCFCLLYQLSLYTEPAENDSVRRR